MTNETIENHAASVRFTFGLVRSYGKQLVTIGQDVNLDSEPGWDRKVNA